MMELIGVVEASKISKISVNILVKLAECGQLKRVCKIGELWQFDKAEIDEISDESEIIGCRIASEICGVPQQTMARWARKGIFKKAHRVGFLWKFCKREVEAWDQSRRR